MSVRVPPDLRSGEPVLVSACVLGREARHDGGRNSDPELVSAMHRVGAVLEGRARVREVAFGRDLSAAFRAGADAARAFAEWVGARYAFLKERSPSCGVEKTHAGGDLVAGPGVATARLREAGITVHPAAE